MFERLYVDNYRTLTAFRFEPPPFSVLVGENGTGKTALWEVLCGLQDVVVQGASVADAFPTSTLTRWDARLEQTFELDLRDGDERFHYELALRHDRERETVQIAREVLTANGAKLFESNDGEARLFGDVAASVPRATIPFGRVRSFLAALEPRPDNRRTIRFRSLVERFWLFKLDPPRMESISKGEATWLARNGSNFAAWYRELVQSGVENETLFAELREALPSFSLLRSAPTGGKAKQLMAVFDPPSGPKYELTFEELSDGQRALCVLYAVLHGPPESALLVFDEPENHVALSEIQPWLVSLRRGVAERGQQVVLMSHNPEVIDFAAADCALEVYRTRGGPTQIAPLEVDLDAGLKASEVVAMGREDEAPAEGA
jgi:predicted ATPase